MALQYKLPKQEPRDLPLSESSSTQTAKEFIRNECQIIVPFKLRVYIKGEARYLKPEQTLGEVFAMGGAVLNVNYTEAADKQRDRRKQAKATADLVRADVEREGLKNREHTTAETNRLISAFSPQFGPGEENATANQLRQRKAAAAERFDEMIKKAAEKEASIRKFSPSKLRGKLAAIGAATHGTKAVLVRRLLNAAAPAPQAAGAGSSTGANAGAGSEVASAAAKARKEEPAAAAKLRRQATAAPRKRGADADDTGVSVGTPSTRRRSVDKSMPGGEPPEGVTAAHGARGSQLPESAAESAAESALARLPRTGRTESAAESALAPAADLEHLEGVLLDKDLSAEAVRERLLRFPKEARLPLWHAWGKKFVRLPEAPTNMQQVLVYDPRERLHYYVREGAVQRSSETDPLTTALARIHFAARVSRGQPRESRAARATLLRDYHPDKTGGAAEWAAAINYIQDCFAEEG